MKKRLIALALALVMCLTLFPAMALGAEQPGVTVSVTETGIKADAAFNTEGYGSLAINASVSSDPKYGWQFLFYTKPEDIKCQLE